MKNIKKKKRTIIIINLKEGTNVIYSNVAAFFDKVCRCQVLFLITGVGDQILR